MDGPKKKKKMSPPHPLRTKASPELSADYSVVTMECKFAKDYAHPKETDVFITLKADLWPKFLFRLMFLRAGSGVFKSFVGVIGSCDHF